MDYVKRVYRAYPQEKLSLRLKRPRRNKATHPLQPAQVARAINEIWSMAFVADVLFDRRNLRMLTVVALSTRERLAVDVGQSVKGDDVVRKLNKISGQRGLPETVEIHNGSEFISKVIASGSPRQWFRSCRARLCRTCLQTPASIPNYGWDISPQNFAAGKGKMGSIRRSIFISLMVLMQITHGIPAKATGSANDKVSCIGSSSSATAAVQISSPCMTEMQKSAVEAWLKSNENYRIALLAECKCESDMPLIRKMYANIHPFFAEGDFNGDKQQDFAVVVVDASAPKDGAPRFFNSRIIVFNGPLLLGATPAFVSNTIGTPAGTQLFYTANNERLLVGKWESSSSLLLNIKSGYELSENTVPRFLVPPYGESSVMLVQGPMYADDGKPHFGAGFSFDYAMGDALDSRTWKTFPVRAAADGVAIRSCQGELSTDCLVGYGNFVLIKHDVQAASGEYYYTLYAHLESDSIDPMIPSRKKLDIDFDKWREVKKGAIIGRAGNTGLGLCQEGSKCIHLHFEVLTGGYSLASVDPYDISTAKDLRSRADYPEFSSLASCGPNTLWEVCPRPSIGPAPLRDVRALVVISDQVNLRNGPNQIAKSLLKLSRGDSVRIVGSPNYHYPRWWWPIEVARDTRVKGWVAEELVVPQLVFRESGLDKVQLGMTLEDARDALPGSIWKRATDGDGLALIEVFFGRERIMQVFAAEESPSSPVDWKRKITYIESFSPVAVTADGVAVGSSVSAAEKVYGPLLGLSRSEIESREYVKFVKQPMYLIIRSNYGGIYDDTSRQTIKYKANTAIYSIAISR